MEPLHPVEDAANGKRFDGRISGSNVKPSLKCCVKFLKSNLLLLLMLSGVLIGAILGVILNKMDPKLNRSQIVYLRFPGDMFIQSMQMLLIPIVVSSLLCSTAEIDLRSTGKIGLRAMVYYLSTLVMASVLGIILSVTIRPGERTSGQPEPGFNDRSVSSNPGLAFMDLIRNMIPDNLVDACFMSKKSSEVIINGRPEGNTSLLSETNESVALTSHAFNNFTEKAASQGEKTLVISKVPGINMIGLVVSSILFGCVTSAVGEEARPFLQFMKALRVVSFKLVAVFLWYSPIGIAFLIAANLAGIDDPGKTFTNLGIYTLAVVTGLFIHGFGILSLIYLIVVRKNPLKFLKAMSPALVFAFGSDSSNATLPLTIKCLEEKNHVDSRVTKLIASVGATVNMDGASLYYSMMTIFVAQINGIPLSVGELVTMSILVLSIAIGIGGVPGTGVVFMTMILTSMGLPTKDIGTILAVKWLLSRCSTTINVLGDAYGAGIIAHLSRHELLKMNRTEEPGEPLSEL